MIQVLETPALEIASKNVSTVEPETDVGQAAKIMREKDIGVILVAKKSEIHLHFH